MFVLHKSLWPTISFVYSKDNILKGCKILVNLNNTVLLICMNPNLNYCYQNQKGGVLFPLPAIKELRSG